MINTVPFVSLLSKIVDNRGKTCPVSEHGMPLIATNCVKNNVLYPVFEKVRYVSKTTYLEWFRGHPEPGDLIFVTKGSPGNVCMAPDPVNFCIAQDMVAIRADESKIYPKYLFALLRSREVQANIENMHVGTLIPHFKKGDFDKLFLPVPDGEVQEYVGDLHFDLCAKIELNQRMNETLEAMARALFKSWFVDFDPVRAKAEGRTPEGMDAATAALFPSTFNDNGLPEGWEESSVIDSAEYLNGAAYKNMHFTDVPDALPVIKIVELKNGITANTKYTNTELGDKYKLDTGDILFSWSGSPDTSIDTFIWTGGKAWLNQHIFKVVNKKREERCFTYWLLKYLNPVFIEIARDKQTTGLGHVTRKDMERLTYTRPTPKIIDLFYNVAGPIMDRIEANAIEESVLAKIRDALLPKLIFGDLRIDDAAPVRQETAG